MNLPRRSLIPSAAVLAAVSAAPLRADSLWKTSGVTPTRSMYADHKASCVGDILTVVVQESSAAQSTENKESTRKSTLNDAVQQFLFPPAVSGIGTHAGSLPSISISGASDYTGGGQVTNSQSVTSQAAVLVTDVLPNGNMVIEGMRMVTFSGETQYVVLHGLVRPDDVSPSNTVLSSNIAEARVEFVSQGAISDAQKLGWFSKLYETLRPF
jgi:flagellar L-ring protein precursor FlgH